MILKVDQDIENVVEKPVLKDIREKILTAPISEVCSIIERGFGSDDVEIQKECAERIAFALAADRALLIEKGFATGNLEVQKACVRQITYAAVGSGRGLFQLAKEKLGDRLVEPPLYKSGKISDKNFSRSGLKKTGSETTLLGGELKGKTILRHIKPEAFLAWQELYEDHEFWKQEAFDYVPIEPIQSFKLNKYGLVDVFSGVLDLSFNSWKDMCGDFVDELDEDKKKILDAIDKKKIKHQHPHNNNFCLRFFRDANGKVDFSRKPRIYLIDFDQAVSPAN